MGTLKKFLTLILTTSLLTSSIPAQAMSVAKINPSTPAKHIFSIKLTSPEEIAGFWIEHLNAGSLEQRMPLAHQLQIAVDAWQKLEAQKEENGNYEGLLLSLGEQGYALTPLSQQDQAPTWSQLRALEQDKTFIKIKEIQDPSASAKTFQLLTTLFDQGKTPEPALISPQSKISRFIYLLLDVQRVEINLKTLKDTTTGTDPYQVKSAESHLELDLDEHAPPIENAVKSRAAHLLEAASKHFGNELEPGLISDKEQYLSHQTKQRPEVVRKLEDLFKKEDYTTARKFLNELKELSRGPDSYSPIDLEIRGVVEKYLSKVIKHSQGKITVLKRLRAQQAARYSGEEHVDKGSYVEWMTFRDPELEKEWKIIDAQLKQTQWEYDYWAGLNAQAFPILGDEKQSYNEKAILKNILDGHGLFGDHLTPNHIHVDLLLNRLNHPRQAIRYLARRKLHEESAPLVFAGIQKMPMSTYRHTLEIIKYLDKEINRFPTTITASQAQSVLKKIVKNFSTHTFVVKPIQLLGQVQTTEVVEFLSLLAEDRENPEAVRSAALKVLEDFKPISTTVRDRLIRILIAQNDNSSIAISAGNSLTYNASRQGMLLGGLIAFVGAPVIIAIGVYQSIQDGHHHLLLALGTVLPALAGYIGAHWDYYKSTGLSSKFKEHSVLETRGFYNNYLLSAGVGEKSPTVNKLMLKNIKLCFFIF